MQGLFHRKKNWGTKPFLTVKWAGGWAVDKAELLTKPSTNQDFASQALTDCDVHDTHMVKWPVFQYTDNQD